MTPRQALPQVGTTFEDVLVRNLSRTQLVQYAGASGDFNPLHTDEVYATRAVGFPSVFAHGMFTMAVTSLTMARFTRYGPLVRFGGRFVAQVWPGDDLRASTVVNAYTREADLMVMQVDVTTVNQHADAVFRGTATVRIDGDGDADPL